MIPRNRAEVLPFLTFCAYVAGIFFVCGYMTALRLGFPGWGGRSGWLGGTIITQQQPRPVPGPAIFWPQYRF